MASFVDYGVLGRRLECLWGVVGSCGRVLKNAAVSGKCGYCLPAACCLLPVDDL
jgi:hypothetical protein